MGKVRLAGRVPDDNLNGLTAIAEQLVAKPHRMVLAVVKLNVAEVRRVIHDPEDERFEDDEDVPVVQVLAIEPLTDGPIRVGVLEAYRAAYFKRTGMGSDTLDFELEATHGQPLPVAGEGAGEQTSDGLPPTSGIAAPAFRHPKG